MRKRLTLQDWKRRAIAAENLAAQRKANIGSKNTKIRRQRRHIKTLVEKIKRLRAGGES